jgi:hypothetical protein
MKDINPDLKRFILVILIMLIMKKHYLSVIYQKTLIKYRNFHKRFNKKIRNSSFPLSELKRISLIALAESLGKLLENLRPRLAATVVISLSLGFNNLAAQPEIDILKGGTSIMDGGSTVLPSVLIGSSGAPVTFIIENTGNAVLNISGITVTGNTPEFSLSSLPTSVAAASTDSFTVTFTPTLPRGSKYITIIIGNDDADEASYQVDIYATAITPEINIKKGTTSITDGGNTTLPNVLVGSSGAPVTFTIENTGNAVLNISGITLTGTNSSEFALAGVPTSVSAGSTGSFTVTFSPTSAGAKVATINISSSDLDEASYQVNISSTGTSPEINVKKSTTSIPDDGNTTLPDVSVGSSGAPVTFTIENTGNAILNISGITLTGTNSSEFALAGVPTSVSAGSTGSFTVTFSPTSAGAKVATINISSSDLDEASYQVNISATATVATAINTAQANIYSYKLYPNPGADKVTVELELKSQSDVKIALSDLTGREVMIITQGTASSFNTDFQVESLSEGAYAVSYFINGIPAKSELLMVR